MENVDVDGDSNRRRISRPEDLPPLPPRSLPGTAVLGPQAGKQMLCSEVEGTRLAQVDFIRFRGGFFFQNPARLGQELKRRLRRAR